MSQKLPITLLMFATSRGHYGCNTIYSATIEHLSRQIPLSKWGALLFHIKIAPGEEAAGEAMKKDLESKGFIVETEFADWKRGQSHFQEYLKDQIKMSNHPAVRDNPFVYWTDDDYLAITYKQPYQNVLKNMIDIVSSNRNTLSCRFLRENDSMEPVVEHANEDHPNIFYSNDFNWQPVVMRSKDFYRTCKTIKNYWNIIGKMHGEALWREATTSMSQSPNKHAVWIPKYAEVANIGVKEYYEVASRFNLTINPNL